MSVRVRFAPSPTGYLHVGSLRTALYDYLYAKKHNGHVILRIEDTDRERLVEDAIEKMISTFKKVTIEFDEGPVQGGYYGPYIQSERIKIYQEYATKLIDSGAAYYCFCTKEDLDQMRKEQIEANQSTRYNKCCLSLSKQEVERRLQANKPYVIRLNVPKGRILSYVDAIHGPTEFNSDEVDDQILLKSDGFPTYHLAVVIDDYLMKVTHAFRADEWIPSTPKQLLLYEAFGWEPPIFVHIPMLINSQGKKLSKRDGDVSVEEYLEKGYLPEALLNFLALQGWNPGTDEEFFTLEELTKLFSLEQVNDSACVFDVEKLKWMNGKYIRKKSIEELVELVRPYFEKSQLPVPEGQRFYWMVESVHEKLEYLAQIVEHLQVFYKGDFDVIDSESLELLNLSSSKSLFGALAKIVEDVDTLTPDNVDQILKSAGKEANVKGKFLFMPIRLALSGEQHGPDLKLLMCGLGKDEVMKRLQRWF